MYSDFISAPIFSERPIDGIVFIAMEEEYLDAAFSFCMQVRRHMIRSGYFHPGMKDGFGSDKLSLKGMIRLANRMKFSDCVIIGSREIEANEYEVKDLKYHEIGRASCRERV